MARKRKSTSEKKDPAAVEEDQRMKKRISSGGVESEGDSVGAVKMEEIMESGDCDSTTKSNAVAEEIDEKLKSPVPNDDRNEEEEEEEGVARFLGEPVPDEEARKRWPHRYQKNKSEIVQARRHFVQAEVDGQVFFLEDDAHVKGEPGKDNYICKIIELFQAVDGSQNFTAQWYYRADDTVIKTCGNLIDDKRIFFSEIKDDNPLDCLVKKLRIVLLPLKGKFDVTDKLRSTCDYYCDNMYLLPYSSFVSFPSDSTTNSSESGSTISSDADAVTVGSSELEEHSSEKTLLDLYSGCGAMSTGLCLGANSCGVQLVTKWAVDINQYACESLKLNHPETQVRNESAEDFLHLIMKWEKLCASLLSTENNGSSSEEGKLNDAKDDASDNNGEEDDADEDDSEVFEVDEILAIGYGDPNKTRNPELHFKVRWKGYGPEEDTWEPLEGLSACQEKLKEFVSRGYKSKILPLPGTVDVICGGPPCQGISGFNRFRNKDAPLEDPKNKQLVVFMDIVAYLKPKFVLMENVVDIVKFAGGFLGRYALGRLVAMGYQARMGMMAAGAYGLPQFRMRMFMWGALPTEKLPQYPLPTHNVVVRGVIPTEFESNTVGYEEGREVNLKKELFLGDAISDLPTVENNEERDEMPYNSEPQTDFQSFIRLRRDEMPGSLNFNSEVLAHSLYDHRPLLLNQDDYERVCQIPKKKGANFRDLPGVRVRPDNKVEWDPNVERKKVSSGKPLVPDYAMTFVGGSSSKPFGRLWWDETVPTVVTRAEPHNQAILHPVQDRVLTIRENARLQGFPDYYKLIGPIKERYIQVGNAVAVPVARALGFSLALALRGLSGDEPLITLPEDYPLMKDVPTPTVVTI
ncbi:DNA (cytosine-5-)-methyltransferase [Handroanthus impetiginosus]|uniref:DNA (cytosine-5-)-methyltransferase n=1 Tax=Handroanthus impetiginosus TaxID=429701 RepID=A0A2G9H0B0_9LAMI|nr:DNA (cytosine-5-)-methyltransferase [Handroanthus impetiginosus]